ncbi:3-dehydroquinate synthase [Corynebacterium lizhenjunii]|uniref:3-dehydroquinate synthase n=1 Tax=Corynebacterium lizhenjunii TaxID=2709394 RepID=UPI0013EAFA15|nr:3-dehydroquinate synthase [Corynebacterium lizhenjunii]
MTTHTIEVSGPAGYEVTIGSDLRGAIIARVQASGARKVGIIHQPSVQGFAQALSQELRAGGLAVVELPVPDAEAAKTLQVAGQLWDHLGRHNFSRADLLIGVGGGAATDLAGFVASGWMRGIKVIHVPTTLLAMVDAAVGGKTGINTAAGKNLVGAFYEPDAVFVDIELLRSLPQAEIIAGSAEIIKTGFIHDPVIIERYLDNPAACLDVDGYLPELVRRSVVVKAAVVSEDLKESGLRETLNYGHTFGHAVELREDYTWRHGHAVAVGMMFIAHLAHNRGLIGQDLVEVHREIIGGIGLPTSYPGGHFEQLYAAMGRDKKNRGAGVRFVALTGIGATTRIGDASVEELKAAYAAISSGAH